MKILMTPKKTSARAWVSLMRLIEAEYKNAELKIEGEGLLLQVDKDLEDADFIFFNLLKKRFVNETVNVEKFTWGPDDIVFND